MAAIVRLVDGFHGFFERYGDPRTNNWFLMSSPVPTILICLTYVYIVKVLGPKLMANRKPFVLREVLIVYNLFQVLFSAWLFYEAMMGGWWDEYSFKCQPVNHSTTDPKVLRGRRLLDKVECLNLACDKVVFGAPHWCWLIGKRRKIRYREICKISGYTVLLYIKTA
ncbi:hypothetical protein M8J76_014849 [Diaphorina citri]|nr:hypothetical protein M8J76_014849 [Diaphorina citri]